MPTSEVVRLMRSFKTDIARAGSAQQVEMSRRWLAVERRLMGQMEALAYRMDAVRREGGTVTPNMLLNDVRYQELLIQLQAEQVKYTQYAEATITDGQRAMASAGVRQSQQAIAAQVSTSFNRLPVSAVEHMVGLTGAGTPLNSLLVQSWPLSAQGLTQALVDGVALGWGPRKTAKMMAEGATGTLDRMLTIARTEQLRVHRESSLATYKHSGIVTGYRRLCAHDRRTCAACILDEGHVYDLDEEMPEHPNGRCSMIPVVRGAPPVQWLKGEEWFEQQDAATQQDILGKGRYEGWKAGQFALQDLVKVTPNSTWGPSVGVTPLKELAGQAGRVGLPPVSLQSPVRVKPIAPTFDNVKDAETWARENISSRAVSYRGLDVDVANTINRTVYEIIGENPNIPKISGFVAKSDKAEQYASAHLFTDEIRINTRTMGSAKKFAAQKKLSDESEQWVKDNYTKITDPLLRAKAQAALQFKRQLVGSTIDDMIAHEVGHHIDFTVLMKQKDLRQSIIDRRGEWVAKVSAYADKDAFEFVAESFMAYRKGERENVMPELLQFFEGLGL